MVIAGGIYSRFFEWCVLRLEAGAARYRRFLEGLQLGNRAKRLQATGQLELGRALAPGYYALVLHVRGPGRRGYAKLHVSEGSDASEGLAYGLVTKQERSVFRIIWLPHGATEVRLETLEVTDDHRVPLFRLHRVPRAFAWRRMLRRIGLEHAALAGRRSDVLEDAIVAYATQRATSKDEAVFGLYDETFGLRARRGDYAAWLGLVEAPSSAELRRARAPDGPLISVLLPVYEPELAHLEACLNSVLTQSYLNWELCVVDDASPSSEVRELLTRLSAREPRVKLHFRQTNGHICTASNDALARATGTFVALLDHDDMLTPHALWRVAEAVLRTPAAGLLYGDEDKLGGGDARKDPHFKSGYNPELLLAQSYMGHLVVARTSEVRALAGFRPGYEGSQDHDLLLRLSERLEPPQIVHIPHILYHWRESEHSTALHPTAKSYAADAGLRAVRDALVRRGENASAEHEPLVPHGYRVSWSLPSDPPLVSLIVPTRDAHALLRVCVESVLTKSTYPHFELLILDNGSVEPATHAYFAALANEPRVRVVHDPRPFNFSALNNLGVSQARGQVVALVNNDIEVITPGWLTELVSLALRPAIGCVGAKLLYPDDTIQHAGVVTGIGGVAGHAHKRFSSTEHGYFSRLRLTHAVSAVTAACLVVRKSIYAEVGGLDEQLAVAFNDVDFCLKVREAGYRNVFTPHAVLYHHESATRGLEVTDEQHARFRQESSLMKARWGHTLRQDPFYSPHLSLEHEDFSIGLRA